MSARVKEACEDLGNAGMYLSLYTPSMGIGHGANNYTSGQL
jgi:hypothetical protein